VRSIENESSLAFVDLNPIRVGNAQTIEDSQFTTARFTLQTIANAVQDAVGSAEATGAPMRKENHVHEWPNLTAINSAQKRTESRQDGPEKSRCINWDDRQQQKIRKIEPCPIQHLRSNFYTSIKNLPVLAAQLTMYYFRSIVRDAIVSVRFPDQQIHATINIFVFTFGAKLALQLDSDGNELRLGYVAHKTFSLDRPLCQMVSSRS
jgi:hypothetical protein